MNIDIDINYITPLNISKITDIHKERLSIEEIIDINCNNYNVKLNKNKLYVFTFLDDTKYLYKS